MKYTKLLESILLKGKEQHSSKAPSLCLINSSITLNKKEIEEMYEKYKVPKSKLEAELQLYMEGETLLEKYNSAGIDWWNYIGEEFENSYPQHFQHINKIIKDINNFRTDELYNSRNWVQNLNTNHESSNQHACMSTIQFQIIDRKLYITVFQRSADANLGLPCDIYQIYLLSKKINIPLGNITFFLGNVHIYENNITNTINFVKTGVQGKFNLNV